MNGCNGKSESSSTSTSNGNKSINDEVYDTTMTELTEQTRILTERHNQLNDLYEYVTSVVYPISEDVFTELIDSLCIDICFDIHHEAKVSIFYERSFMSSYNIAMAKGCGIAPDFDPWIDRKVLCSSEPGLDIFGQRLTSNCVAENVACPHCDRTVHATRFSQHLEKCMGLGRNSGRSSSRRVPCSAPIMPSLRANNNLNISSDVLSLPRSVASVSSAGYPSSTDGDFIDDDSTGGGNSDYMPPPAPKRSHKKGGGSKKSNKLRKNGNNSNGSAASDVVDNGSTALTVPIPAMLAEIFEGNKAMRRWAYVTSTSTSNDDNADLELAQMQHTNDNPLLEKVTLYFQQHCGVVSALTGRMCAKTRNCHQHSEAQRQLIRARCISQAVK